MVNATAGSPNDFQIVIRYEFAQQNMNHTSFEAILFLFFFLLFQREKVTPKLEEKDQYMNGLNGNKLTLGLHFNQNSKPTLVYFT